MPSPRHLIASPSATAPPPNHVAVDDWRLRAACFQHPTLKPETWNDSLPVDGREPLRAARIKAAIAVCDGCPVKAPCLADVDLEWDEGVRGGLDLRKLKEKRFPAKTRDANEIEHGTERGERAHRRRGEKGCDPCIRAARLRHQERRRAINQRRDQPVNCGACGNGMRRGSLPRHMRTIHHSTGAA